MASSPLCTIRAASSNVLNAVWSSACRKIFRRRVPVQALIVEHDQDSLRCLFGRGACVIGHRGDRVKVFGYAGLVQSDPPGLNLRRPPSLPPDGGRPLSGPRRRIGVSTAARQAWPTFPRRLGTPPQAGRPFIHVGSAPLGSR